MQHIGPLVHLFLLPLVMCLQEQTSRLPNCSPQVTLCHQYTDTDSFCNHCLSTIKTNYNYCCLDLLVRTTCQLCHKEFNNCPLLVEIIKTMADASILIPIKQNSTYNKMLPSEAQENLVQRIILQLSVATVPAPWTSIGKAINRLIESSRNNLFYVNRNIVLNSSKQSLAAVKPRSRGINTIEKVVDFPEDVSSELKQLSFVSQFVNSSWILFPALQIYNTQQETGQGLMPQMKTPLTNTDSGFQTLPEVSKTSAYSQGHPFVMNYPESKKFITKGNKFKMENKSPNPELVDGKKSSWQATGNSLKSIVARNLRSIKENKKTDKTREGLHLDHDLDVDNSRHSEPRINQDKKWGSLGAGKFRRWWFGKVST